MHFMFIYDGVLHDLFFGGSVGEVIPIRLLKTVTSSLSYWRASAGALSTSVGPLPGSWLAACIADHTPDLQVFQVMVTSTRFLEKLLAIY